ncbi:MAG: sigma-54-dependent Fis family transcriptional regulator [Planctomyces sp.]|nr:sigma-54-dependent Fis family transcriptional regulator [Planctomyces sp.]
MTRERILLTWIGHADMRAFAKTLTPAVRSSLLNTLKLPPGDSDSAGPVKTLLNALEFDRIHVLSNYPKTMGKEIGIWLGERVKVHSLHVEDPTDYGRIYSEVDSLLKKIIQRDAQQTLSILLSPGTPAMAAVWVLLGKTTLHPVTFYQTHQGRVLTTEIPFDLTVDVIPRIWRDADNHLLSLASTSPRDVAGFESIVGESAAVRIAVGRAKRAAQRDVPVLILGESGTGKELFARAMHLASPRRDKPFLAINCAAIPAELQESELFGFSRGSFTGADKDRAGAFEQADGGTLFLDEVGECSPALQAKLLRALQPLPGMSISQRSIQRVGESRARTVDVRLIAATNRDLHGEVSAGRFRDDLLYRLAVVTLLLPPLRVRKSDIPLIADHLLARINQEFGSQDTSYRKKSLSPDARAFISRSRWPGNIRELYNALLQAAVMCDADVIDHRGISESVTELSVTGDDDIWNRPLGAEFSLESLLNEVHRHYLARAMQEAGGVKAKAARLLGIENYQTLDAQLKRLEPKTTTSRSRKRRSDP